MYFLDIDFDCSSFFANHTPSERKQALAYHMTSAVQSYDMRYGGTGESVFSMTRTGRQGYWVLFGMRLTTNRDVLNLPKKEIVAALMGAEAIIRHSFVKACQEGTFPEQDDLGYSREVFEQDL